MVLPLITFRITKVAYAGRVEGPTLLKFCENCMQTEAKEARVVRCNLTEFISLLFFFNHLKLQIRKSNMI